MLQYRYRVEEYLTNHRPDIAPLMTADDMTAIAHRISNRVQSLIVNDPTPQPNTTDHIALVTYHQQIRSRAEEIAMDEELYQAFPPPEEEDSVAPETSEFLSMFAEIRQLQNELMQLHLQDEAEQAPETNKG